MFSIFLLCVGTLKPSPTLDMVKTYLKRMKWRVEIKECKDNSVLIKAIDPSKPVIAMDEHGENMSSTALSNMMQTHMNNGQSTIQFIIGGADGLPVEIKKMANKTIAFGAQTWPHMMVRVMVMEQLYRAQQILDGHPYHRE